MERMSQIQISAKLFPNHILLIRAYSRFSLLPLHNKVHNIFREIHMLILYKERELWISSTHNVDYPIYGNHNYGRLQLQYMRECFSHPLHIFSAYRYLQQCSHICQHLFRLHALHNCQLTLDPLDNFVLQHDIFMNKVERWNVNRDRTTSQKPLHHKIFGIRVRTLLYLHTNKPNLYDIILMHKLVMICSS